jgi:hypothetical protein
MAASIKPKTMSEGERKKAVSRIIASNYPNFDPVLAMVDMVHEDEVERSIKFQCLKEVAQYLYPKLKSVEVQVEDNTGKSRDDIIRRLRELDNSSVIDGEVAH